MPYARTSLRSEKRELRERMRAAGLDYRQIATEFSRVYNLRPRPAWREAYGWSLQDAAGNINAYRGETGLDPAGISGMTAAHLCEHENWPGHADAPTGRKPSPYLLAVLASIYDCQASDLIDLADRQHLPREDLLVIDTYARPPSPARIRPDFPPGSQGALNGVTTTEDASGNCYLVLVLPPGPQRIAIDITSSGTEHPSAAIQPVRRLKLAAQ
jgi:hypothetical protein